MNSMEYTQWMNDANTTSNGSNYFDDITMEHVRNYYNDPVNNLPVFHHPDDAASKYRYCGNTDWYEALNKKKVIRCNSTTSVYKAVAKQQNI